MREFLLSFPVTYCIIKRCVVLFNISFYTLRSVPRTYGDDWNIDFFVPVYASFHIPLSDKVNLRLNAGAYTGSGEYWNLGATAAAGLEVKRFYVGVNYFQNCVNDRDLKLGLSVGYKFTLF